MPLTDTAIRNAKIKEKQYKLADDKGLYLLVNKSGKYFRFDYRFGDKRKTLALGVYPDVKLKEARERRDHARHLLQNDIDPSQHKKETRNMRIAQTANSLEAVAREWFTKNKHTWTEGHSRTIISRLENNVFPWLCSRPVAEITAPEVLAVLRRIEERGAIETAHRIKQICGQVFRYAIATGRADRDPSSDLRGALSPTKPQHMATITDPKKVGELLRAIDGYEGHLITRCALRLAPLVFVRPGELRHAEWAEINFDLAEWKIPAEKMKMRTTHIVPLSSQSLDILRDINPLTGRGRYVFPSLRSAERPMSNNTILAALRRMGYAKEEMSGHGFRAMASTVLHEQGWPPDVIERQLAHAERNNVRAAYNHAQHLPERRRMMQAWADYLDALKPGAKIIPIRAAAR
ncbi:MAG: tyrosine-type recombinase/integrase [Thermodesulfobacteriota bacterium]